MRVLVIGGGGMAGHMIVQYLRAQSYDVWQTTREELTDKQHVQLDVRDEEKLTYALESVKPAVVINAAGILNEAAKKHLVDAICVNSMLPHQLASMSRTYGYRLIHISTDCVFSGTRGGYTEADIPDGTSAYARTKTLGEVTEAPHVTLRTSIIGPDAKEDAIGLFAWFMRQRGCIRGFRRVFWNGVTTLELAKVIEWVLTHPLTGLVQIAAPAKISKYELLCLIKETFGHDEVTIEPDDAIVSDKSLCSTRTDFTYPVPPYPDMLLDLKRWMEQ